MESLKPCPFCGSENIEYNYDAIDCDCGASMGNFNSRSRAIEKWNNRQTAWELFQRLDRLLDDNDMSLTDYIHMIPNEYYSYINNMVWLRFFTFCPESKAIEIMKKIEKEVVK